MVSASGDIALQALAGLIYLSNAQSFSCLRSKIKEQSRVAHFRHESSSSRQSSCSELTSNFNSRLGERMHRALSASRSALHQTYRLASLSIPIRPACGVPLFSRSCSSHSRPPPSLVSQPSISAISSKLLRMAAAAPTLARTFATLETSTSSASPRSLDPTVQAWSQSSHPAHPNLKYETFQIPIDQSPLDDRQYRLVRLANGLEAMLIHDPTTDKSTAAMDVKVGHLMDPAELPGCAHFCEHLLFLVRDPLLSSPVTGLAVLGRSLPVSPSD